MEENRIDPYQIVGFLLLIACAVWVFYFTPEPAPNIDETESAIELSDDQVLKPVENIKSNDLEFSITEIQQELSKFKHKFSYYQVSDFVNTPKNNSMDCIAPFKAPANLNLFESNQ